MELRSAFHRELRHIDEQVLHLYALVREGLAGATGALLSGDRAAARDLVARDRLLDSLYVDIEDLVQRQFALQAPMAADLRFLLSALRIVPELERSGDLVEHIAQRAARGLTDELTPRIRGLIEQMGRVGVDLWQGTADAYANRDPDAADRLRELDDELDDLHVSFIAEVASGKVSVPVAIELALLGRFYERLGDHAVNIAARVHYLVTGRA
jgi:phosphate transport system protein